MPSPLMSEFAEGKGAYIIVRRQGLNNRVDTLDPSPSNGRGYLGSADWMFTSFGRKIEDAVNTIRNGAPTVLVGEEHWLRCL